MEKAYAEMSSVRFVKQNNLEASFEEFFRLNFPF